MKRIYGILAIILLLGSCKKEEGFWDGDMMVEPGARADFMAILTVKKTPTDTVYFQLDDATTIFPRNYQENFSRMERIFCDISVYNLPTGRFTYTGTVNWAEPVDEGVVTADASIKGDLGLDIIDDWMTSVEDGYLTVHYNTWWGSKPVQHSFYVISGTDPADPYTIVLEQKAGGDKKEEQGDALVCFDINSLPDTEGNYKELTLKWTTGGGEPKEKCFEFKTRQ